MIFGDDIEFFYSPHLKIKKICIAFIAGFVFGCIFVNWIPIKKTIKKIDSKIEKTIHKIKYSVKNIKK